MFNAQVKTVTVEKKINEIVNRLEKTKEERYPDLAAEKESRDSEERNEKKAQLQEQKRREKEEQKRKKEMEELRFVSSFQNKAKHQSVMLWNPHLLEIFSQQKLFFSDEDRKYEVQSG